MKPKKTLPAGSEELAEQGRFIIVKTTLEKQPYYMIYEFFEAGDGRRYWARGAGNSDIEVVLLEFERITGKKLKVTS
ncbi:hypothetical protein E2P71_00865 [Candidatus Bathyarchaeota archaeon]|nr:hypothetical protein E2P71_00865 [Candidatus Bathyarchaeota archaeon]